MNEGQMKSKSFLEVELLGRGVMITVPLILLRRLFLGTLGKYVLPALPFINLGIAFGLALMAGGVGIIIWKFIRNRKHKP